MLRHHKIAPKGESKDRDKLIWVQGNLYFSTCLILKRCKIKQIGLILKQGIQVRHQEKFSSDKAV